MAQHAALDELERDALTELVNIGVSRAAASLRQMVGRQVLLSVPSIEVIGQHGEAASAEEVADMEQEALAETGNIILNGCLGTMANMLHQSLTMTLPTVFHTQGASLFTHADAPVLGGLVLFLYINFSVLGRDIRGYIAMLLDMPSLAALKLLVAEFIDQVMSDDADAA